VRTPGEYLLTALLLGFLAMRGVVPAWNHVHSDFANYYVSARLVVQGESLDSLYNNEWFKQKMSEYGAPLTGKFAPFPPVTAWMMIPLTSFDVLNAQRVLTIVNLLFVLLGVFLLRELTKWKTIHGALFLLGGGLSVVNNIAFGQVYLIMTVFILLAFVLYKRGHLVWSGIPMGFFAAIKYFPILFSFSYFLSGVSASGSQINADTKSAFSAWLTLLVLIVAQFLFFGTPLMIEFINSILIPHLDGQLAGQGPYSFQFQSWDSFLRNLFVADQEFNPHSFIFWPGGRAVGKIFVATVVTVWTGVVLYRYRSSEAGTRRTVFISLPALAALVLLPASATYHFALLIIPVALLLSGEVLDRRSSIGVLAIYVFIGFIPYSLCFKIAQSWGLFFAFPRLWLISALYIIAALGLVRQHASTRLR
jgi:hypothetical protein